MSKAKRKKITPRTIVITVALLVVVGLISFLLYQNFQKSEEAQNSVLETDSSQTTTTQQKSVATASETKDESDGKTPEKYEGENPNDLPELSGSISSARVLGDNLVIRVNIDQFLSSGTCSLRLTSGEKVFTKTTNIEAMVSTSTCDGFEIPVSSLSSGNWNIEIVLSSGQKTGVLNGEVII